MSDTNGINNALWNIFHKTFLHFEPILASPYYLRCVSDRLYIIGSAVEVELGKLESSRIADQLESSGIADQLESSGMADRLESSGMADQLKSSGMATLFGKLSTHKKKQKFKNPSNIHKNAKIF